jgi:hypothetical protein
MLGARPKRTCSLPINVAGSIDMSGARRRGFRVKGSAPMSTPRSGTATSLYRDDGGLEKILGFGIELVVSGPNGQLVANARPRRDEFMRYYF